MALTLEEMEREAYQRGDVARAELLRIAIDGENEAIQKAEWKAEDASMHADGLKESLEQCQMNVYKRLRDIESAIECGDKKEALELCKQLSAETEGY